MGMFDVLKAGFMGFGLCVGVEILVFYLAGTLLKVSRRNFIRVFVLAGVASFVAVDLLLYYRIVYDQIPQPMPFLSGCIGGWLGGVFFGLTQFRPSLTRLLPA